MINFRRYNNAEINPAVWSSDEEFNNALSSCMISVFTRMFAALLVTAISAFAVTQFSGLERFVFGNGIFFFVLLFAPVGLVMVISAGINKMKASTASMLFYIYAIVNGLTLSIIFYAYELGAIFQAFAVTSLMFGGMAVFGYTTKKDLSRIGNILYMALFGIVLVSLMNFIFFRSEPLSWLVSYVIILVFVGLTAWDTQRIKYELAGAVSSEQVAKISVIGALRLYLNFINIFLHVLRILGRKR